MWGQTHRKCRLHVPRKPLSGCFKPSQGPLILASPDVLHLHDAVCRCCFTIVCSSSGIMICPEGQRCHENPFLVVIHLYPTEPTNGSAENRNAANPQPPTRRLQLGLCRRLTQPRVCPLAHHTDPPTSFVKGWRTFESQTTKSTFATRLRSGEAETVSTWFCA